MYQTTQAGTARANGPTIRAATTVATKVTLTTMKTTITLPADLSMVRGWAGWAVGGAVTLTVVVAVLARYAIKRG